MNRYGYTHKFGAVATEVDGHKFPSMKEAKRYGQLRLMERGGLIKGLVLQPKFELMPAFTYRGKKIRNIEYWADFTYEEDGKTVVEDAKGFKTPEYKIKRKLFLAKYPQFIFKET